MDIASTNLSRRGILCGGAFFSDSVDGKFYDTGSLFITEQLDESKGNAFGSRTVEYPTTDSALVKKLQKIKDRCPMDVEIIFSTLTSKRGQKLIITDCKPIAVNPKAA